MTITEQVAKTLLKNYSKEKDYRIEIVTLIDAEFLQFVVIFLKSC
jgi:DNA-dependent RNA polymerase auxiliary subunit epsilon